MAWIPRTLATAKGGFVAFDFRTQPRRSQAGTDASNQRRTTLILEKTTTWRLGPVREPIDPEVSARIDALRIILIGLIVLCHGGRSLGVVVPVAGPGLEFCLAYLNNGIDSAVVPLFFCISGFLLLRKMELSWASYGTMLKKKCLAVLVPFLLFNAIWIVWICFVGSIDMFGAKTFLLQAGVWRKLLGMGTLPLNYPLWFLRDLLLVFLAAPLFLVFYKRMPWIGLTLLLALWLLEAPADAYSLGGFAFAFYLGGFLARLRVNLRDTAGWDRHVVPTFLTASLIVAGQGWYGFDPYGFYAFKKFYVLLGVAFFWCVSRLEPIKASARLHRMAAYSFFIFLTHEPTVSILQSKLLHYWKPTSWLGQCIFYVIPGLAALCLLYGLGRLLARWVPAVYAVASGSHQGRISVWPLGQDSGSGWRPQNSFIRILRIKA